MAKEWYLMNDKLSSGYDDGEFLDYTADGFDASLGSDIGRTVELYNYDLSEKKIVRVILEGSVSDSQYASTQRRALFPIGSCHAGMYMKYKNRYWIIFGLVDDNGVYEKAVLHLCNYKLCWKNSDGKIIERWCYIESAAQYNNGETRNNYFILRTDQLMVYMPDDDETLMLSNGCRFIIDKRCRVYEKDFQCGNMPQIETSYSLSTYELTRADSILFNYLDSGCFAFIASQDEKHPNDGYYRIGNNGYWLCDGSSDIIDVFKSKSLACDIIADELCIYSGLDAGIFTACFYDKSGNVVNIVTPKWTIQYDHADKLHVEYIGNSISISVDDDALINDSFELLLNGEGYTTAKETISIRAFL